MVSDLFKICMFEAIRLLQLQTFFELLLVFLHYYLAINEWNMNGRNSPFVKDFALVTAKSSELDRQNIIPVLMLDVCSSSEQPVWFVLDSQYELILNSIWFDPTAYLTAL